MTIALIVAAGSGERLGADRSKALVEVAGRPCCSGRIDALAATQEVEQIVVALPPGYRRRRPGETRRGRAARRARDSVRRALAAARGEPATRCSCTMPPGHWSRPSWRETVIAALAARFRSDAAIAAAPVTDTIKRAGDDGGRCARRSTRCELWAVQTPQVFRRAALERALDVADELLAARPTMRGWSSAQAVG